MNLCLVVRFCTIVLVDLVAASVVGLEVNFVVLVEGPVEGLEVFFAPVDLHVVVVVVVVDARVRTLVLVLVLVLNHPVFLSL